jgi:hypothetical protein
METKNALLITLATALAVSLALAFAFNQQTFVTYKPITIAVDFENMPMTLQTVNFNFNETTWRYSGVSITLNSTVSENLTAKFNVQLYTINNTIIAYSTLTTTLMSGTQTINIPLTWNGNCTVNDLTNGIITVQKQD